MATDAWGIDDGWEGVDGEWHPAPASTIAAARVAMGGEPDEPAPPATRPVWIVRPGAAEELHSPCELRLEDGSELPPARVLPTDLPLGIHDLVPVDGGPTTHLVVSPGRCHLPAGLRAWGVVAQVPACRSRSSWGIGDLADVRALAGWLSSLGGRVLGLSPLHAPQPVGTPADSPYYPSSRRWRNPLLLRVDELPGAEADALVADLSARARVLLRDRRIDRGAVWDLQRQALERLWARRPANDPAFDRWRAAHAEDLDRWTTYAALAERHGPAWPDWPAELQHPGSPAVERARAALSDRRAFHAWVQLQIERQLAAACPEGVALVQDLAIGVDPAGSDAWGLQDLLALDARVGAPPDAFAPAGQDWGLPPFIPWRLRDAGYRPLARLFRGAMTTGGLRVDHVMGLSRLFWIPPGADPTEGTYVRFAPRELLEVVAMESARARALVVGEDLGTVEPAFRHDLAAAGVLSTRLVWFEDGPPESYPEQAMAAVTTHDLPTLAGAWTGADEAELDRIGVPAVGATELRERLARVSGLDPARDSTEEAAVAVHARLARSPSVLAVATMEDVCGVTERPNVPGTSDERANWSLALPVPLDDLAAHPLAGAILSALAARTSPD